MRIAVVGLVLAIAIGHTPAMAQEGPTVSLAVPDPARWDVAGYVGWIGVNKGEIAPARDEWYDAASFGASAAYYWAPHVKLEVDIWTTTRGRVFVQEPISILGQPFPSYRYGEHRFRSDHLSGGLQYQFFENTWFHPFAGAGIEGVRESGRLELQEQRPCPPGPCVPVRLPVEASVSYRARPYVHTGFKWYVSERAFIRSDIRSAFSTGGPDAVQWRTGFGVDF